ncbi:MAG: tetratricopeptide repeat protein [Deltaproteobacteria bacterium]|nr:tetratricopeptide repeat protein [Deltaproteobacteria bacterium]
MTAEACLREDDLFALMGGELDDDAQTRLEAHLDRCEQCRELVAWVARSPLLVPTPSELAWAVPEQVATAAMREDSRDASAGSLPLAVTDLQQRLPPGWQLGRYVVRERIGAGGMGVVYDAWDPALDRTLAIKLLRARSQRHADGRARLLREARAIAQLSHPNVVAVYDVGEAVLPDDSQAVFVAMEFVAGPTLRQWLDARRRSWRAIAAAFLGAARGLSAAHELGIVHRDFKPGNVMMAAGDRAVVLDFGLARMLVGAEPVPAVVQPLLGETPIAGNVTQTHAMLGTPAYMAPEQRGSSAIDGRADQFAWAVSFAEALLGAHPFAQSDAPSLAVQLSRGPVPRSLRQLLVRACATQPSERHPSMFDVVDRLERVLQRRAVRRGAALGGSVLLLGAWWLGRSPAVETTTPCERGAHAMATVWNDARRATASTAFVGAAPWLSRARTDVVAGIDAYAERWIEMRDATCRAGSEGSIGADQLDRRMMCLTAARTELDTLLAALEQGTSTTLAQAVTAVSGLSDPAQCDRDDALATALPEDHERRAELLDVQGLLAQAHAWERAGAIATARELLDDALARARRLDEGGTEADARTAWARQAMAAGDLDGAQRELIAAQWAADRVHDLRRRARAQIELVWLEGYFRQEFDRARQIADEAARSLAELDGGDPGLEVVRLRNLAWTDAQAGRPEQAEAGFARALAACEHTPDCRRDELLLRSDRASVLVQLGRLDEAAAAFEEVRVATEAWLGPEHPELAAVLNNIGAVARERGDFERALAQFDRVIQIVSTAWGEEHVIVARARLNRGTVLADLGREAEAAESFEQARLVFQREAGAADSDLARAWKGLAGVAYARGELEAAREGFERALELETAVLGERHPSVAVTCTNLAMVEVDRGHVREAIALHRRAETILREALGPEHPHLVVVLDALAYAQAQADEPLAAIETYQRAIELATTTGSPNLAQALSSLGTLELGVGRTDDAREHLERALALREDPGQQAGDPVFVAQTRFALARALPSRERRRAVQLARDALAALAPDEPLAADVRAWIDDAKR